MASIIIPKSDLKAYALVYAPDAAECNKKSAEKLAALLCEKAALTLPVYATEEAPAGKAIYLVSANECSENPGNMRYSLSACEKGLKLVGGGYLSVFMGACELANKFLTEAALEVEDGIHNLRRVTDQPLTEGAEFRVMSYNIMAQWPTWGGDYMPICQRFEGYKGVIDAYSPDVAGIQEVSDEWSELLPEKYGDTYEFVNRRTPDDKFYNLSTIIYKKDKFDVVASGLQYFAFSGPNKIRLVDWAIFKDKTTEKKFAFFNTHWCFYKEALQDAERIWHARENSVIIRSIMAKYPDVKYAFSTADYNTLAEHPIAVEFRKNAQLIDSFDVADEAGTLMNRAGGCSSPGVNREGFTGGGRIDNIYITPNMKILRYETVLWNGVEHVSDHSPKYADIVLD